VGSRRDEKRKPTPSSRTERVRVRLIRKPAQHLNGVDVSRSAVGDTLELDRSVAARLIRNGWAVDATSCAPAMPAPFDGQRFPPHDRRRAEDVIREELRDSRAVTVRAPNADGGGRTSFS
jgi:hypothetical protein